jgi:hypothetical protein
MPYKRDINSSKSSWSTRLINRDAGRADNLTGVIGDLAGRFRRQEENRAIWELSKQARAGNENAQGLVILLIFGMIAAACIMPSVSGQGR